MDRMVETKREITNLLEQYRNSKPNNNIILSDSYYAEEIFSTVKKKLIEISKKVVIDKFQSFNILDGCLGTLKNDILKDINEL